ncbi:MAG: winged helix-turn-helix domain-containing protein [Anaerolineae bacterium]
MSKPVEVETVDMQEAFEVLKRALKQALDEVRERGTRAFQEGRYADAQRAAQKADRVASELEHLETLRALWSGLVSEGAMSGGAEEPPRKPSKRRRRIPRGLRTQEKEFWIPILTALEELGGQGEAKEVVSRVGEIMEDVLNEYDRSVPPDGKQVRWHNSVHWCRFDMVRKGLLAPDSPAGIWEITEKGRQYLQEHRDRPGEA